MTLLPGGTLRIRVSDPDTKRPLTARIIVRGEGVTLDPSFGPDYRATGAGKKSREVVQSILAEVREKSY